MRIAIDALGNSKLWRWTECDPDTIRRIIYPMGMKNQYCVYLNRAEPLLDK